MCHEEGCGGHFGIEYTKRKIMQTQVTWPCMYRDVVHWCGSCHQCQLYQQRRLILEPLGRIVSYTIFPKWGLDIIGPLPSSSIGNIYIMSAEEYVSQCLEERATRSATSKEMAKIVYELVCRFGVPLELVTDNSPDFRGDFVKGLVTHLEIAHIKATPYHPQCNGLVEAFNGSIQKLLFKLVYLYPQSWDKELNKALWARRMT